MSMLTIDRNQLFFKVEAMMLPIYTLKSGIKCFSVFVKGTRKLEGKEKAIIQKEHYECFKISSRSFLFSLENKEVNGVP